MAKLFSGNPEGRLQGAERDVLDKLRLLDDDWTVFWSVERPLGEADFYIVHRKVGAIVLEVKGGILAPVPANVRVKFRRGGRPQSLDMTAVRWARVPTNSPLANADPRTWPKDPKLDPGKQVAKNRRALVEAAKGHRLLSRVQFAQAVWFPHGDLAAGEPLGPHLKPELVLGRSDMYGSGPDIAQRLFQVADGWRQISPCEDKKNLKAYPLSKAELDALVSFCKPGGVWVRPVLTPRLVGRIEHQLLRLTQEQVDNYLTWRDAPRALICGLAGTGKTLMVQHRAIQAARKGSRVLVLCNKPPLAANLRASIQASLKDAPDASTPVVLARESLQAWLLGIAPEVWERDGMETEDRNRLTDSMTTAEENLRESQHLQPMEVPDVRYCGLDVEELVEWRTLADDSFRFDCVLVDEAQEFSTELLKSLTCLLSDDPDSKYHAFADPNQSNCLQFLIRKNGKVVRRSEWNPSFLPKGQTLRRNVRSSSEVARVAQRFIPVNVEMPETDRTFLLSDLGGAVVRLLIIDGPYRGEVASPPNDGGVDSNAPYVVQSREQLNDVLATLVWTEEMDPESIVVIADNARELDWILPSGTRCHEDYERVHTLDVRRGDQLAAVRACASQTFKGMEANVVVLVATWDTEGTHSLFDGSEEDERLRRVQIYVSLTRAKAGLVVITTQDHEDSNIWLKEISHKTRPEDWRE